MADKIAILGGGPTAAFVWRACIDAGLTPHVYVEKIQRVATPGAFFIYWLPESIRNNVSSELVHISGIGTAEKYASKLWNLSYPTSFPSGPHTILGYEPFEVLRALWGEELISYQQRQFCTDEEILALSKSYDIIFQTFPTFFSRLEQQTKSIAVCSRSSSSHNNLIIYNGEGGNWLRMSFLFGKQSYECVECLDDCPIKYQPGIRLTAAKKLSPEIKPTVMSVTYNVFMVGRFATWNRKFLAHQAYHAALEILRAG